MLSEEPRGPGSMASSGYVVESEAGTSFTGSSYVDPPPGGEPPSLAPKDCPDDEVCIDVAVYSFKEEANSRVVVCSIDPGCL